MRKNFVLDTNVLLHDPDALNVFEDNTVVIPIYVLEEIDKFKKDNSELGRNARTASRMIDDVAARGVVSEGVENGVGGLLRVAFTTRTLPDELSTTGNTIDSRIIAVALEARDEEPERPCVLVSKDVNLRVRARALGLEVRDYEKNRTRIDELFAGFQVATVPDEVIDALFREKSQTLPELDLEPHEFVELRGVQNPQHTALARAKGEASTVIPVISPRQGVWGLKPRNREQVFALDLLLDPEVMLVTLVGKAGTGKTLLALAAGLHVTQEDVAFERLLVSRPIIPMGKDIGYLPGTIDEKMRPWLKPIFDNLDFLMGGSSQESGMKDGRGRTERRGAEELMDLKMLEVEPLTYIRGRSLPNQYIIVDEAQNLTPHEAKTIVSRAGKGTKIVLTGDPYQVDNPYIDASSNGLVHVANRFQSSKLAGHVTLTQGERSALAEEAANLL